MSRLLICYVEYTNKVVNVYHSAFKLFLGCLILGRRKKKNKPHSPWRIAYNAVNKIVYNIERRLTVG